MSSINKRKRLQYIIQRLEYIMKSSDFNLLISDTDIRVLEALLGIKPYSTKSKDKEIKKISCRGLKYGKKKSSK